MARKKRFDPVRARKIFVLQRRLVTGLFVGVLLSIVWYFYVNGYLYDYHTEYALRDVKTAFQYSNWSLLLDAAIGILWRWGVLFLLLSLGVTYYVFRWAYRTIARRFVFACPKCRGAIRLFDSWICEYCPKVNFHTITYNLFTECEGCHYAQDSYQCADPQCGEVMALKEGADVRRFARQYGAPPPQKKVPAPAMSRRSLRVPDRNLSRGRGISSIEVSDGCE